MNPFARAVAPLLGKQIQKQRPKQLVRLAKKQLLPAVMNAPTASNCCVLNVTRPFPTPIQNVQIVARNLSYFVHNVTQLSPQKRRYAPSATSLFNFNEALKMGAVGKLEGFGTGFHFANRLGFLDEAQQTADFGAGRDF